jgi:hypothetical protein
MTTMSMEERLHRSVAGDAAIIATMARSTKEKYGEEGLTALRDGLEETYRRLIPSVARQAGARVGDGTIEDWATVEAYICQMGGMEFELEVTPEKGVLRVKSCPMEGQFRRISPDCCPDVFIGIERGIAGAINPNLEVKGGRYLPRGEGCCEIICQLKPTA